MATFNPFVTGGYVSAEYFCDRVEEAAQMTMLLENGNNIALIAPRRVGKTDLISHVMAHGCVAQQYLTFVVDIYSAQSLADFVEIMGRSILARLKSAGRTAWERFVGILASVRSELSYDYTGNPTWSLGFGTIANPQTTLEEIFHYLETAERPCLVAIDEFQQIARFPEAEKVEALLRTHIQRCRNTRFVFSGSQRHMMAEIFLSPSRPFYQSVTMMSLPLIGKEVYRDFCQRLFMTNSRTLEDGVAERVYDMFDGVTSYMQKVMNMLFAITPVGHCCGADKIDAAVDMLLNIGSDGYSALYYQLTEKQRALFVAIIKEGKAKAISGAAFIRKHRLPSASSVQSASKVLLERDFITRDNDTYSPYDLLFAMWVGRIL